MMLDLNRLAFRASGRPSPQERERRTFSRLCFFLACFYAAWTAWAVLLARHPDFDHSGILRAAVRLSLWVAPTLVFIRLVEGRPVLARLGLLHRPGLGVVVGLFGSGVVLVLAFFRAAHGSVRLAPPTDLASWLNPILSAPLAEEVVFRGLVFRVLRNRFRLTVAFLASAVLFALIHLPYWLLTQPTAALAVNLASMVVYGFFFALLYCYSGSLWAPLVCHMLNNLINLSLQPR